MRTVEPRLGRPLDGAATACTELADELMRVVALADGLMQRVQQGAQREELKGWFSEVKNYARATLRVEALASLLQEEVQRSDAVLKLLGSLSLDFLSPETDAAPLLEELADLVQSDLPRSIECVFIREAPCVVGVPRATLVSLVCAAIEIGLENILAGRKTGRITLRTSGADGEVVIEVADDGPPGSTDLRATLLDSVLCDVRTTRLRELRERTRRVGGDLLVDADDTGNVVSIYLPALSRPAAVSVRQRVNARLERSNR